MTTLAANNFRVFESEDFNSFPVIANDCIYGGAAVGDNGSGYARPLQAGDPFRGFAVEQADNRTTDSHLGTAGQINCRVRDRGVVKLSVTGVAGIDDVGKAVYASDDNTFTLTASTNTYIGRVHRPESGTTCMVKFDAGRAGLSNITALTDSSGGSADGTISAISGSGADAGINDNFAELAAKVNALAAMVG